MWVMHVERVQGDYLKPEIIDLKDTARCLLRLHHSDISEGGTKLLASLLTRQAQSWTLRPPGTPLGPVIPVRWERVPTPSKRLPVGVEWYDGSLIYMVDPPLLSQRAAGHLGRLTTDRTPYWQRVSKGYGENAGW